MNYVLVATGLWLISIACVAADTPTRSYKDPAAPPFTLTTAGKVPADTDGNFVIGPEYPPPSLNEDIEGRVQQFTLESQDSHFYPGIGRDDFGTVDPDNPKTLLVKTHPVSYQRTITVYIPKQYVGGSEAPFIVIHDGPKGVDTERTVPRILDKLIAQRRATTLFTQSRIVIAAERLPQFAAIFSDAQFDPKVRIIGTFPAGSHPPIVYPAARVAGHDSAAAIAFLHYLGGPEAAAIFKKYGFTMGSQG